LGGEGAIRKRGQRTLEAIGLRAGGRRDEGEQRDEQNPTDRLRCYPKDVTR